MKCFAFILILTLKLCLAIKEPTVAPFVDVTRMSENYLVDLHTKTGLTAVTLAFALGGSSGCEPTWGGQSPIEDAKIMGSIRAFQKVGGKIIVGTGGAMGPYLEASCSYPDSLARAYRKIFDVVGTKHLDIDIEATVSIENMNLALKSLQSQVPDMTLSYTLMIQGDDYGLTDALGVEVLRNAAHHGVVVDVVNAMTMEFGTKKASWGDAVIAAAESTHKQMKQVWPHKSDNELYGMLGVTPMIGRNYNGKIFLAEHARHLVEWAKTKNVGHLSFWSIGRDNGKCPNGGISPDCSSIAQSDLEFTKIFQEYAKHSHDHHDEPTTPNHHTDVPTDRPTESPTKSPHHKVDCTIGVEYFPHETDCNKYYWCFNGEPHLEHCGPGTVWDPKINSCNFASVAQRDDCK